MITRSCNKTDPFLVVMHYAGLCGPYHQPISRIIPRCPEASNLPTNETVRNDNRKDGDSWQEQLAADVKGRRSGTEPLAS